jgi:hypothetical protein
LNIEQKNRQILFKPKLKLEEKFGTLLILLEISQWVGFHEGDLDICRLKV